MNWKSLLCGAGFAVGMLATGPAFSETISIDAILPVTGPTASTGALFKTGLEYSFSEINAAGGLHGNTIKLNILDDGGSAQGGTDRVRQAIAGGAHIILQGGGSAVAAAISADVHRWNVRNPDKPVLLVMLGAEAADLTGKDCHFYAFRTSTNAAMRVNAMMQGLSKANKLGTRVFAIGQAYSWGKEMQAAVQADAAKYHYQVVGTILHDVNKIQDFSPYVERIREAKPDVVVTGNWARDLLLLMKAASSANLKARFATVYIDEKGNLSAAGSAALGSFIATVFLPESAGAAGEAYRKAVFDKTGSYPTSVVNNTIIGMRLLANAVNAVPAKDMNNMTGVALALEKSKAKWILGEVSIRAADHQLRLPLAVGEVSKDAKIKLDGTDMGFIPITVLSAEQTEVPPDGSCKMQRPK
jgi:branched-chain amino acid transport system substrate-binding protein